MSQPEPANLQELLLALKHENKKVYSPAKQDLVKIGKNAVPSLLSALHKEENAQVRTRIIRVLGKIGDTQVVDHLIQILLKDSEPIVRLRAAYILGDLQDKRAVEPLIQELADPDLEVREAVIFALGNLEDTRAVEPLLAILEGSEQSLRIKATEALGELKDLRAFNSLLAALKDPDPELRDVTCRALGDLKSQEATRPLLNLLKTEPDPHVRCTVIQTLGFLKDKSAVPELFNYLSDPNPDMRLQTIHTLGDFQDERAIKPLVEILKNDKDSQVRSYAAGFLSKFEGQPDVIEPLIAALADKDGYVRMNAVSSLTELEAYQALEEIMQSLNDESVSVRWWACQYLEKFGDKRALPALEHLEKTTTDDRIFRKKSKLKEAANSAIKAIRQRAE